MKVTTPLEDLGLHAPDGKALVAFLKAMEFTTITKRAAETFGVEFDEIDPDPALVGEGGWRARNGLPSQQVKDKHADGNAGQDDSQIGRRAGCSCARARACGTMPATLTPAALAEARAAEGMKAKIDPARL